MGKKECEGTKATHFLPPFPEKIGEGSLNFLTFNTNKNVLHMKKRYTAILFGAGLLTFSGLSAQSGSQIFTTPGPDTFLVPQNVTTITVEVLGAGGDGGGNGGGGGGGGGFSAGTFTVTPLSVLNIYVGPGGAGSNGGSTGISALGIWGYGGDNGTSVSNPNIGGGGLGGYGNGGNIINHNGGDGGGGYWTYFGGGGAGAAGPVSNGSPGGNTIAWTGNCVTPGGSFGAGGGAPGGDGGKGAGFTDVNCNVTDPAGSGQNYGAGGGGGNGNGGLPGNGSGGWCRISWGTNSIAVINGIAPVNIVQNPFTDYIKLQNTTGTETFELQNTNGQLVWSGKNIMTENFSALASGIYFVKVIRDNQVQVLKALKQ